MTRVGRVDPRRVVRVTRDGQSYSAIVVDAPGVEKTDCSHNLEPGWVPTKARITGELTLQALGLAEERLTLRRWARR
jgi:hypothetical protein